MFQRKTAQIVSARNNNTTAAHKPTQNENKITSTKASLVESGKAAAAALVSGKSVLLNANGAENTAANPSRKRRALTDLSNQVAVGGAKAAASKLGPVKTATTRQAIAVPEAVKPKTTTRRTSQQLKKQAEEAAAAIEASKRQKTVIAEPQVWDDLDEEDREDPMMVSDYVVEIFENLRESEKRMMPDPHYMVKQKELRWKMRAILVDWLVEVHQKFKLLPETLFLTVNVIDRFLSLRSVPFSKLQLVGITAMFIAAKYEEVYAPSVTQYVYMADGGYEVEEVLKAERSILTTLGFNLQYPNPLNFLRRVSKADDYDLNTRTMGKYLMEVTLLDESFLKYTPSMIAAAAIYISRWVHSNCEWNANLEHYAGYSEKDLQSCVTEIINFLHKEPGLESVKNKYSLEKNRYVACTVERWLDQCVDARSFSMPWL